MRFRKGTGDHPVADFICLFLISLIFVFDILNSMEFIIELIRNCKFYLPHSLSLVSVDKFSTFISQSCRVFHSAIQLVKGYPLRKHDIGISFYGFEVTDFYHVFGNRYLREIFKCIVKHCSCIVIRISGSVCTENNCHQVHAIFRCQCHQSIERLIRVTGLSTHTIFIILVSPRKHHLVMLCNGSSFISHIGGRNRIFQGSGNSHEICILKTCRTNECHISRGSVVFIIVKTM